MNLLTRERQLDEPCPSSAALVKRRRLEFNDVRAGRLVAESINGPLVAYFAKALMASRQLKGKFVMRDVPFVVPRSLMHKITIAPPIPNRVLDIEVADVLLPSADADITVVTTDEDSEDDAIVQWFADQRVQAEESFRSDLDRAELPEHGAEEVMLTRRHGSRARQSWRGGGAMRRL